MYLSVRNLVNFSKCPDSVFGLKFLNWNPCFLSGFFLYEPALLYSEWQYLVDLLGEQVDNWQKVAKTLKLEPTEIDSSLANLLSRSSPLENVSEEKHISWLKDGDSTHPAISRLSALELDQLKNDL